MTRGDKASVAAALAFCLAVAFAWVLWPVALRLALAVLGVLASVPVQ